MIPKRLEECFIWDGYREAMVYKRGLAVYYKFAEGEVYAVALYDYNSCGIKDMEKFTECGRSIKASFYHQSSIEKVNLLHIFCVDHAEDARELCYGYDETWIFEVSTHRLIIFENQRGEFFNARPLIEQMDNMERKKTPKRRRFVPYVTIALVVINVIMFLMVEFTGSSMDVDHMLKWGAMDLEMFIEKKQYYRLITEMFLHFGVEHLLNNMLVLFVVGNTLERYSGHLMFLGYYMATGITAGLASLYYHYSIGQTVVSAGASGAIFGIVGVIFFFVLINKGRLEGFTTQRLLMHLLLCVYAGAASPSVDFMAHAGGFAGGFLMALLVAVGVTPDEANDNL